MSQYQSTRKSSDCLISRAINLLIMIMSQDRQLKTTNMPPKDDATRKRKKVAVTAT